MDIITRFILLFFSIGYHHTAVTLEVQSLAGGHLFFHHRDNHVAQHNPCVAAGDDAVAPVDAVAASHQKVYRGDLVAAVRIEWLAADGALFYAAAVYLHTHPAERLYLVFGCHTVKNALERPAFYLQDAETVVERED